MLRARILFNKDPKNSLENVRMMFDDYAAVSLLLNNKVYQVTNGEVTVSPYEFLKHKADVSFDILVPNAYVYTKAEKFLQRQIGKPFDTFGATLGQYLGLGFQSGDKWYDAEIVSRFLQYCLFDEIMEYNASKMNLKTLAMICESIVKNQSDRKRAVLTKSTTSTTNTTNTTVTDTTIEE
jgi:hypothetical protein